MSSRKPAAPRDLGPRGRKFWTAVMANYELSIVDVPLLVEACRNMDSLEELQNALVMDGVTSTGSRGQLRVHPAVAPLNAGRALLQRQLAQLNLPDLEGEVVMSPQAVQAQRAAQARWAQRRGGRRGAVA